MNLRLSLAGTGAVIKGHPWILANAQLSYRRPPEAGTLLKVQDSQGDFLGWALSEGPGRAPAFRMVSRERRADFGEAWWQGVVERALAKRGAGSAAARRLLDSESDGTPGLVCEACGTQGFLSLSSGALTPFLPLIEKALVDQTRLRGLWRRFALPKGAWGSWHRAPLAPLSPARFEAVEGVLRQSVDLDKDASAAVPPWPVERRSWRAWAFQACAGADVLALGDLGGEAAAVEASGPRRYLRREDGFLGGLDGELDFKPGRVLLDVPLKSNEKFGRFDAAKHAPALLGRLCAAAAPDALWLLSSAHPSLAGAEAWAHAWEKAGLTPTLAKVLGPEPDCPELPHFPEGRRRRAFVFSTAPGA